MNRNIIEIQNLSKYYGKTRGIDGINLTIEEGEIFGFIGPNGAGKSTTIRILLNLIFPSAGTARIMGKDVISVSNMSVCFSCPLTKESGGLETRI